MLKIKVLSVGKTREQWLNEGIQEYVKRLQKTASLEFLYTRDDQHLERLIQQETHALCLDASGKAMSSEEFSDYLMRAVETAGSRLTVIIGGAEGLSQETKSRFPLISLSPLTFTHQMCRLILVEQIYRAFEIVKGSQYHK